MEAVDSDRKDRRDALGLRDPMGRKSLRTTMRYVEVDRASAKVS